MRRGPATWAPESWASLAERERALRAALEVVIARRAWTRAEVERFQAATLRTLVAAAAQVPLYREKFAAARFDPATVRSLADLHRIPVLTKAELRRAPTADLVGPDAPAARQSLSSSGSTGTPCRLFRDDDSLWLFSAYELAVCYDWTGGRPLSDGLCIFDLSPGSIDAALADHLRTTVPLECIASIDWPQQRLLECLRDRRPEFISTYPSTIRTLAHAMRRERWTCPSVTLLHLTSEMCDAGTRRLVAGAFPKARIMETYASTEAGLLATRCAEADAWHVAEELNIVEIVDDAGRPTTGPGRVVVTSLTNRSTPVIRYDGLGDSARWGAGPCRCGSSRRVIEQIEGRFVESLVRPDGTRLTPYAVTNALEEVPGVAQFQVIQRSPTDVEILLVPDHDAAPSARWTADVRAVVQRLLGPTVEVAVRSVGLIPPRPGSHKTPLVISEMQDPTCATP